ncbi:23S rRNA (pseudouridine(1915)-N(3))-methyltransferase RlmH [Silvibacterium dinghuense]|uniref:23S rRNA (pseudouridine(1915)-N(3))-methyltransferase RlmH n=1 Tax=Silvibacterium dinghuense TaxID=1560006 RepID=UPI001E4C9771|nr:23S rRNA (pseudouridine(1915)-N(3))-methyltransferase RlmH [Silvibacterium dinghuense]
MKLQFAAIGVRTRTPVDPLVEQYLGRIAPFAETDAPIFRSAAAFWENIDRQRARPLLVLLDSRGRQFSSEDFAAWLGRQRDEGQQRLAFAIGPADGWSGEERKRAGLLLSLGPMTLPHELARLLLCEQVYRAFTILSGHPYHTGH